MPGDRIELDLHRLELRFADSRLVEPRAVARLAESIERCGQIVPCIVVAAPGSQDGEGGGAQALVLIDGYRRVGALRRLGRDTVGVEQWSCDLTSVATRAAPVRVSGARKPRHARYRALRVAAGCSAPRLTDAARVAI